MRSHFRCPHDASRLSNAVLELQQLDRVASEDFVSDVFGEVQRIEQFELRDLLAGHEDVGAEQELVGVADQELAAEVCDRSQRCFAGFGARPGFQPR